MEHTQEFFSLSQTARLFGVGEKTIYNWIKKEAFKTIKIAGRTYISKAEIEAKTKTKIENKAVLEFNKKDKSKKTKSPIISLDGE